jgi:hypothetical protein
MRLFLVLHDVNGRLLGREKIELDRLPEVGTGLRPPVCETECFVTSAVPASLEDTGDLRFAGTVYADVMAQPLES